MAKSIYLVEAPTQYALASTFLRFQEHYESPKFRNQFFSLEEFMDWYAEKFGGFTYLTDWSGFNIPSRILKPFRNGNFDPLSKKEQHLLKLFEKVQRPFYIIGVTKPFDLPTLKHEVVHGLFYTDKVYQKKVLEEMKNLDTRNFKNVLGKKGYHTAVHEDEVNAYATTGFGELRKDGLDLEKAKLIQKALKRVFKDHFGFSLAKMSESETLKLVQRIKL